MVQIQRSCTVHCTVCLTDQGVQLKGIVGKGQGGWKSSVFYMQIAEPFSRISAYGPKILFFKQVGIMIGIKFERSNFCTASENWK